MLLIYASTVLLSVQNLFAMCLKFNSFLIKHAIFTASTTAVNSSLGIGKNLFGVTLDLPTSKLQCIFPLSYTSRMLLTALAIPLFLRHPRNYEGWFLLSFQTCEAWYISTCAYFQHLLIFVPNFVELWTYNIIPLHILVS